MAVMVGHTVGSSWASGPPSTGRWPVMAHMAARSISNKHHQLCQEIHTLQEKTCGEGDIYIYNDIYNYILYIISTSSGDSLVAIHPSDLMDSMVVELLDVCMLMSIKFRRAATK